MEDPDLVHYGTEQDKSGPAVALLAGDRRSAPALPSPPLDAWVHLHKRGVTACRGRLLGLALCVLSEVCPMVLIFSAAVYPTCRGGEPIDAESRRTYRSLVLAQYGRVDSLYVRHREIAEIGGRIETRVFEWAMSGERRYRKRFWSDAPDARYGVAVYDGSRLLSYDSALGTGTSRSSSQYDPAGTGQPETFSPYSRAVGHYTRGAIWEILGRTPLEDWVVRLGEDGKTLAFHTDAMDADSRHTWVLDMTRGYLITKYTQSFLTADKDETLPPFVLMETEDAREFDGGVWLPTRFHVVVETGDRHGTVKATVIADEIRVNSRDTEKLFAFSWPKKAIYHDYVLNTTVDPNASDEAIDDSTDKFIEDVPSALDGSQKANPGNTAPRASPSASVSHEHASDDLDRARELVAADTPRRGWARSGVTVLAGCVALGAVLVAVVVWGLSRRSRGK